MELLHNAAAQVIMFSIFIENSGAVAPLFFYLSVKCPSKL